MGPDLFFLYRQMLRSRRFEEAVKSVWEAGKISGEMHLGIGEEAIAAGVVGHLQDGDAMSLDYRCTPPLIIRGIDPVLLLNEFMGKKSGLCGGQGGHMHMFSRSHLVASSGIVGASGPVGAGFALAAQYLGKDNVALAFFGEGAFNQGSTMEALNLAAIWKLPLIFVCKNNKWAISTVSRSVTGGDLLERARGLGVPGSEVDGTDVEAVWKAAGDAIDMAREGGGPSFLMAHCSRLGGHFLGDPLQRVDMGDTGRRLMASLATRPGAELPERIRSIVTLLSMVGGTSGLKPGGRNDPIIRLRKKLNHDRPKLEEIENAVEREMRDVMQATFVNTAEDMEKEAL